MIEKFGSNVMSVAPRVGSADKDEWFFYSTGLFLKFKHPEIMLCGLSANTARTIIHEIGNGFGSGRTFEVPAG